MVGGGKVGVGVSTRASYNIYIYRNTLTAGQNILYNTQNKKEIEADMHLYPDNKGV